MKPQDYLSETGVVIFKAILKHLKEKGVTDSINSYELSMLANSMDMYAKSAKDVQEKGYDQWNERSGARTMSPAYTIMKIEYTNIIKHSPKFGLNPVDMAKMVANLPKPKEEGDALIDLLGVAV